MQCVVLLDKGILKPVERRWRASIPRSSGEGPSAGAAWERRGKLVIGPGGLEVSQHSVCQYPRLRGTGNQVLRNIHPPFAGTGLRATSLEWEANAGPFHLSRGS